MIGRKKATMSGASYEAFYGLVERPFSLTPDPKFFFKSRSHGRALESITFGLRRRDSFLLLTGDLGVGKTTISKTLIEQLRRRVPVAYAATPLLSPANLLRLLLQDFAAVSPDEFRALPADGSMHQLFDLFVSFIGDVHRTREGAVLIIDEAHNVPPTLVDELIRLTSLTIDGQKVLQVVLAATPGIHEPSAFGVQALDHQITTRARLLPLGREDCAGYLAHRLTIAGGSSVSFTPRAIDVLFGLSGGVPRLVNLLCERALQESATMESRRIEPAAIEAAASALELLRTRPRRFRWFHKQVS